jgi:hypothetical protein
MNPQDFLVKLLRKDERFQAIMKSVGLPTGPVHPEHTP